MAISEIVSCEWDLTFEIDTETHGEIRGVPFASDNPDDEAYHVSTAIGDVLAEIATREGLREDRWKKPKP